VITAAGARVALVDLYLARGRFRAEVPMLGFGRLSDVFNNAPGEFIGATARVAGTETAVGRRELVVRLRDVRLVRPLDETDGFATPTALRDRVAARVVMDLDEWHVSGEIHLLDRIPWLDFMTASRNRFISVSNASVRSAGVAEPLECPYLLVNGARVSALFEAQ
jgi:hypothetical protein